MVGKNSQYELFPFLTLFDGFFLSILSIFMENLSIQAVFLSIHEKNKRVEVC